MILSDCHQQCTSNFHSLIFMPICNETVFLHQPSTRAIINHFTEHHSNITFVWGTEVKFYYTNNNIHQPNATYSVNFFSFIQCNEKKFCSLNVLRFYFRNLVFILRLSLYCDCVYNFYNIMIALSRVFLALYHLYVTVP